MTTDSPAIIRARARVEALRRSLQAHEPLPVKLVETHISWVLLTSSLAYKLKKPVRLPFLDFTTLAARRRFCEEELRLNDRLAPSLTLGVEEVRAGPAGPAFGGPGRVLDVAVKMRRFRDGALWSEMLAAGTLSARHVDAMARRLAAFHAAVPAAAPDSAFASAATHEHVVGQLIVAIDATANRGADWPWLRGWLQERLRALAPWWDTRRRAGRVRECHGDLHLGNVLQLGDAGDEAGAFDGIEFDEALRWIDVLDDIGFLAMDLAAHGCGGYAFRLLDGYLAATGDCDGLPALRFFMVCRALVRAEVAALRNAPESMRRYLDLAADLARREGHARLAITHGLPGSGKSFVSQALLEASGAIRVRSDVERKRLFGIGALESSRNRVPGGIYDAGATARTYARLLQVAETALRAGWPVIVDAAFLRADERARFADLARCCGVPFTIIDCRAPLPLLRARLEQRQARGSDASEANVPVLERLRTVDEALSSQESACALVADAAAEPDIAMLARQWLAASPGPGCVGR